MNPGSLPLLTETDGSDDLPQGESSVVVFPDILPICPGLSDEVTETAQTIR
jgi:hypothetical protein